MSFLIGFLVCYLLSGLGVTYCHLDYHKREGGQVTGPKDFVTGYSLATIGWPVLVYGAMRDM